MGVFVGVVRMVICRIEMGAGACSAVFLSAIKNERVRVGSGRIDWVGEDAPLCAVRSGGAAKGGRDAAFPRGTAVLLPGELAVGQTASCPARNKAANLH